MKQQILNRIAKLGGDISQTTGQYLIDDLQKITFKEVLHFKRPDEEPFYDFYDEFYDNNQSLLNNTEQFIDKAINQYYVSADDDETAVGQAFWQTQLFTPLTPNTPDYNEWSADFLDDDIDLSQCLEVTGGKAPEFLIFIYSYGYPDHYFICTNDINSDNPTVFGTDHEVYFEEITNKGSLLDFLNKFMTKQEARIYIQEFLDDVANGEVD
ncbi:hypothetical protein [Moraxella oblonga]|uniref:hypothetical protein n=1 Tax=Moraxella oblonga TaxID=200413 RepID=UPI000833CF45|nr:hypothetical protein [Moraxella oblonga]